MKITTLGSGSAFTLENYQTSFLIETKKTSLLFDCGGDTRFALKDIGKSYKDIRNVYITHLHGDHIGGLEWLGFTKFFDPSQKKPSLYIPLILVEDLWNKCLRGGMGSLQGRVLTLKNYFEVKSIHQNKSFVIDDIECQPVQTIHIMNGYYFVPSFGLMITTKSGKKVFFTGDTQFAPEQIKTFYNQADMIIHDCEFLYLPDGTPIESGVHAHFEKLKTLPEEIRRKIWLVHYQDSMMSLENLKYVANYFNVLGKGYHFEID
jgi:ribonuclease BN (tRNA processing enzyme)